MLWIVKKEDRIGEKAINNQGLLMILVEYRNCMDIDVMFEDGFVAKHKTYRHFKNTGEIKNLNYRLNEENINNQGHKMIITRYKNNHDIDVLFPNFNVYVKNTRYDLFKSGSLKLPIPTLAQNRVTRCRVTGCVSTKCVNTKIDSKFYNIYINMIKRGFDEDYKSKHPTYKNVTVCEEWLDFNNFEKWCNENYYEIKDEVMDLDKDWLIRGNKIYSPETCVFIPQFLNKLLVAPRNKSRELPVGVTKDKGKYVGRVSCNNKSVYLGRFDTIEECYSVYKYTKELIVKCMGEIYKDKIPPSLYNVLANYELKEGD